MPASSKGTRKVFRGLPSHLELERPLGECEFAFLMLNFPFTCNYRCKKCFVAGTVTRGDLSWDIRQRLLQEARSLGVRSVVVPGEGEPLLRDELPELLRTCRSLGMMTVVFTNASLLSRDFAELAAECDTSIIVSCDSFREDTYEDLTGRSGSFGRVMDNLLNARDIFRENVSRQAGRAVVRIGLNVVISRQNIDEIEDIERWCADDVYLSCNAPVRQGRAVEH